MQFNKEQIRAIEHFESNCCVMAGAGSGKTSVLIHRIQNLIKKHGIYPNNILAITFSKKAKDNMINKLSKLIPYEYNSVSVETFHSFGMKLIRMFNDTKFDVLSSDNERLKILQIVDSNIVDTNEILSYISLRKNNLKHPEVNPTTYKEQMYKLYEDEKVKQHKIDYDDMLVKTYEIISQNPKALKYCIDKFKFILVDEVQDTNTVQFLLLKAIGQPNNNVFVVGDMLQNVYEWRGSDNEYIRDFHKEWSNVTTINLYINYRSTKNIVDFANNFAKNISDSKHKFYKKSEADKTSYKDPTLTVYDNEFDEAYGIANKIKRLVDSGEYEYKDIAVLSRTNGMLQIYETTFYNENLPCNMIDGISFVDRHEIKLILTYLKLCNDIDDNASFRYMYWQPLRGLGKAFLQECETVSIKRGIPSLYKSMFYADKQKKRFANGIEEIRYVIGTLKDNKWHNVGEQIRYLRRMLDIDKFVSKDIALDNNNNNEKIENLDSLEKIAKQFQSLSEFLDYINKFSNKKDGKQDCVKLLTIHRSKGLEFPVVFLIGIIDKTLPHPKNKNIEEEKRLCYVAITRAEKELYCSTTDRYGLFVTSLFGE